MPPTLIVDDREQLVKAFVACIEKAAGAALRQRGQFALAVTGGRDAQVLLPALVEARVDWSRAHLVWGDERAVPPEHPDSNYGQIKGAWLDRSGVPAAQIHRMPGETTDLEAAARDYEAQLVGTLGPAAVLDACVLGVGPDGHVCSLFPGHRLLAERARLVAAIDDSPKPPARRLTLTLPMLTRARLVVITALAAEKAPVVTTALHDPHSTLPVAQVLHAAPQALVFGVRHH